jgi:hypothetical protein
MNQRYDVLGFGLIVLAFALLSVTGTSDSLFSWLDKWQSLVGSLVGAIGTVAAGWLAWAGVQRQIAHSEDKFSYSQAAAKVAAISAVSPPVLIGGVVLRYVRAALEQKPPAAEWEGDNPLDACIGRLAGSLEHFSLREIGGGLDLHSRTLYLTIIGRLSGFVSLATTPLTSTKSVLKSDDLLRGFMELLEGTHQYISALDADLGRQFAKEGRMSTPDQDTDAAAT